jgi:hypothetical protein
VNDSSDAEPSFVARAGALEPCLRWRLTGDALLCERGAAPALARWLRVRRNPWPERVPLREIASIRARFDPTRFAPDRYRCDLRGEDGARISIFSSHYAGPGQFQDHGEAYAVFVRALVLRTQRVHPSVKLAGGLSWPAFVLQHGLLLASLVALATMLGIAGFPLFASPWAKLAIILTYAGVALRYAWTNLPRDLTLPRQAERDAG